MRTFWDFVSFILISTSLGCSISGEVSSTVPRLGTVLLADSSGVTIPQMTAGEVKSAVIENTSYSFSATQEDSNVKLVPNQDITLTAGLIYRILVSTAEAQTVFSIKAELPSGAVMAFNTSSCPTGWSTFSAGKGRVLVGAGSGNVDADGTALTARLLGDLGGREFTTGIPASSSGVSDSVPSPLLHLGVPTSGGRGFAIYNSATADTTISGSKEDSNMMPFAVVTYCQKD